MKTDKELEEIVEEYILDHGMSGGCPDFMMMIGLTEEEDERAVNIFYETGKRIVFTYGEDNE